MMVFDRFAIALGTVVDGATDGVENITRGLPWHLPARLKEGRAEVVRCRGTVKSGAQCKRQPVPGSAYCYQHRNQAKLDGRLLVVIGARDKAARITSDLFRKAQTATVSATSRLAFLSPNLRAQVLLGELISGVRQVATRTVESLQAQRRWITSAIVLVFVAAVPIAFLILAVGDLDSLARFAREIFPRNLPAIARNSNAAGLFTQDENRPPGTDFAGAYVSGVEHLSASSSMIQIFVPAGVEGTYQAVVTVSERVEYQCAILHHYPFWLYCIVPSLTEASQINLRIFRIDEIDGSQFLVFEANYTTGEFAPLAAPSPEFTPNPTQTSTPTQTPIRSLVQTADDSDSGDDHPPPATPAATDTPPPATPAATETPPPATPAATETPPPVPPAATETPPPIPPAVTETPPRTINEHSCNSKPGHPRYCTPSPDS